MKQLKFTIYLRTSVYPYIENHVDEYEICEDIKYLYLIRHGGEDGMYNLNDVIRYFFRVEEEEEE